MDFKLKTQSLGKTSIFGHLGALVAVVAWGCSFIASKVLMEDGGFTPAETYVYRFAVAYLLLLMMTIRHIRANTLRDELTFFVCGICAGSIYFILENYALNNTTTGNVSLLSSVSPIFTTILMALVYRSHIGFGTIAGSVIAFVGVACVIFSHGEGIEINPFGDVLALMAGLSWAIYSILIKRLIPLYSSLFVTRKLFFYGVITAMPLVIIQPEPLHLHLLFDISAPEFMINILFLILMCSIVGYIIWNEAMKSLGPVTANNYIYMQPLVTMIVAYFYLGEKIYLLGYVGCAMIIGGLIIADKWKPSIRFVRK
jgi:drug/metabolite transporter (DMT)-like permease